MHISGSNLSEKILLHSCIEFIVLPTTRAHIKTVNCVIISPCPSAKYYLWQHSRSERPFKVTPELTKTDKKVQTWHMTLFEIIWLCQRIQIKVQLKIWSLFVKPIASFNLQISVWSTFTNNDFLLLVCIKLHAKTVWTLYHRHAFSRMFPISTANSSSWNVYFMSVYHFMQRLKAWGKAVFFFFFLFIPILTHQLPPK